MSSNLSGPKGSSLKVGDRVFLKTLRRVGTIIRFKVTLGAENKKNELAEVDMSGIRVWTEVSDLKTPQNSLGKASSLDSVTKRSNSGQSQDNAPLKIDLHGLTQAEATSELEKALDLALIRNIARIEVVHGIGTGRLTKTVHDWAKNHSIELTTKQAPHNPGVSFVYI